MVILDAAREIQPPFNPDAATAEFSTLLKAYRVATVIGDSYAGEWVREPFRRHGVDYQLSEASKSDIYRDALPLFNAGRAQLWTSNGWSISCAASSGVRREAAAI